MIFDPFAVILLIFVAIFIFLIVFSIVGGGRG